MGHYKPSEHAGETCTNVRKFVDKNNNEIWKIFRSLAPYIAGLYFLDAIVSSLFFDKGDTGFVLGSIGASYFYICLLISWHRFVIKGADYTPMDPLNPKSNELGFIVVGVLIWIAVTLVMSGTFAIVEGMSIMNSIVIGLPLIVIMFLVSIYMAYRFWFYFPATAVDEPVTLGEAFKKSGGYLWKLIHASILASVKVVTLMMLYIILLWIFKLAMFWMGEVEMNGFIIRFLFDLPIHLYFQPVLVVLGVTAVSNYYLLVLQKQKDEAL